MFLYFGTPSSPAIRQAMTAGRLGCMTGPAQGNRIPADAIWAGDNGRFGKGWPGHVKYQSWLRKRMAIADRCAFMLAPDVPFDMAATLDFSSFYLRKIRDMGFPAALALQNGAEEMTLPWDDFDAVFIAGDTEWKCGPAALALIHEAIGRGKYPHFARANTLERIVYAASTGANSADGTCFAFGPDKNLEDIERCLAEVSKGVQAVLL